MGGSCTKNESEKSQLQPVYYTNNTTHLTTSVPKENWTEEFKKISKLPFLTSLKLSNSYITQIPQSIIVMPRLESLDLSYNQIKNIYIPDYTGRTTNLTSLNLNNNLISDISDRIEELRELIELDLSNNQITIIPGLDFANEIINICLLTKLQKLNLGLNKIINIPESLSNLSDLKELHLFTNCISTIPKCFGKLINLQELDLSNNRITKIPDCIGQLTNLRKLSLGGNQITNIPDHIGKLTNLLELNLTGNQISNVPDCVGLLTNLQKLYFINNQITKIPDCIGLLTNLQDLYFIKNQIKSIPAILGRLTRCKFYFFNNPIEYIPPNVQRLMDQQKIQNNIYSDTQNVHDHNIQESVRQSIYALLNNKCSTNNYIEEILHSSLKPKTKQLLTEYCNDETVHSLNITFSELLKHVWNRITKHEYKEEIIKILDEEMENAECKCFTGRISRLVNVLNGYYDDINIKISDNAQIGTIISIIKQRYTGNNIDELKGIIKKELSERKIDDNVIREWIKHVDI
jgi:Leucine-rich repeat (LRR) protein